MGSGNDGRTLTQTEGIWLSASRNLECSDMGEITITDRPAHPRRAARRLSPTPVVEQGRRRFDAEAQRKNAPKNGAAQRAPGLEGYSTDYPTMTTVTRLGRLLSGFPAHDHGDLAWTMHAAHQNLLDVGGAAGTGDQHHGTGLRRRIGQQSEQLVQAREDALDGDYGQVRGRQ